MYSCGYSTSDRCPEKQGCRPRFQLFLSSSQWPGRRAGVQSKGLPGGSPTKEAERIRLPRQAPEGSMDRPRRAHTFSCLDSAVRIQRRMIKIKTGQRNASAKFSRRNCQLWGKIGTLCCLQRCPSCCNPHMQEIKPVHITKVADLICHIEAAKTQYGLEGISLIGGEPLLQVRGLSQLASWCKSHQLTVLVFTGFLYQELIDSNDLYINTLLANVDILVDGLYDRNLPDTERDWVGSRNQRVVFLTDRYSKGVEVQKHERMVEFQITDSTISMNGWPF